VTDKWELHLDSYVGVDCPLVKQLRIPMVEVSTTARRGGGGELLEGGGRTARVAQHCVCVWVGGGLYAAGSCTPTPTAP
jgi:hypothetical protein